MVALNMVKSTPVVVNTLPQPINDKKVIEKPITKQSKTPERLTNSMGVVAGTTGIIGGGILGGIVGVFKLPGEIAKTFINQDYGALIKNAHAGFKGSFASNEALNGFKDGVSNFVKEIKATNSTETAEELLNISKTMANRLNETFKDDTAAKNVINKVFDPLIGSATPRKNVRSLIGIGAKAVFKRGKEEKASYKMLGIIKGLGFPVETTTIIANISSKVVKGLGQTINNIQNFNSEEREAWGKVAKQMTEELSTNPNIQKSKKLLGHLKSILVNGKELAKDTEWVNGPLKQMQKSLTEGVKSFDKNLSAVPVKTIGKFAIFGSLACCTISVLSWLGLKKILMPKEKQA